MLAVALCRGPCGRSRCPQPAVTKDQRPTGVTISSHRPGPQLRHWEEVEISASATVFKAMLHYKEWLISMFVHCFRINHWGVKLLGQTVKLPKKSTAISTPLSKSCVHVHFITHLLTFKYEIPSSLFDRGKTGMSSLFNLYCLNLY